MAVHIVDEFKVVAELVSDFLVSVPAEIISQWHQQYIALVENRLLAVLICQSFCSVERTQTNEQWEKTCTLA